MLLLGTLVGLAGIARVRVNTTVDSILPGNSHALTAWQREQRVFGGTPILLELTEPQPGDLLMGEHLLELAHLEGELSHLPGVKVVYGPGTVINQLSDAAANLFATLTGYEAGLVSRAEAEASAKGQNPAAASRAVERSFDLAYGPVVVKALPLGLPSLLNPSFVFHVFFDSTGAVASAIHWLVPSTRQVDIVIRPAGTPSAAEVATIVAGARRLARAVGLPAGTVVHVVGGPVLAESLSSAITDELPLLCSVAAVAVLLSFVLGDRRRSLWQRLVPLGAGLLSLGVTVGLIGWWHGQVSLGFLAFLPIMVGIGTDYPIYALRTQEWRWLAVLAAAAVAASSVLLFSGLPFVRQLGEGLVLGLPLSLLYGMAGRALSGGTNGGSVQGAGAVQARSSETGRRGDQVVNGLARRRPGRVVLWVVLGVAALAGWLALPGLAVESSIGQLAAGIPGVQQSLAAESLLGAGGDLEIVVRARDALSPALVAWYQRAEEVVVANAASWLRPVVSPASLLSWLGPSPNAEQISTAVSIIPPYLLHAVVAPGSREAEMVFAGPIGPEVERGEVIPVLRSLIPPPPPGSTVTVTGLLPVISTGMGLLGRSLVWNEIVGIGSFGMVLIAGAVLLERRGRRPKVWRSVLAAVGSAGLAVGWGSGVLAVFGVALSPLLIAVGSLTAAVGGEFAFVVLGGAGDIIRPWRAVIRAAVTSEAGFLALALSEVGIVRQFALVLAGSVAMALMAAWLMSGNFGQESRRHAAEALTAEARASLRDG
jgi:predicted RND superfamily exporter protein